MSGGNGWHPDPNLVLPNGVYRGTVHVGVDLGTAYTVLVVLDENLHPIAGEYKFAQVTRDGLVVDFVGAVDLLRKMKARVEEKLGFTLTSAASAFPPGVPQAEVRATANVLYGAGLECSGLIDEPTAANNVLQVKDGVVVDVGGGTTGVAIFKNGKVVYTADEADRWNPLLAGDCRFNGNHFRGGRGAQDQSTRADAAVPGDPPGDGKSWQYHSGVTSKVIKSKEFIWWAERAPTPAWIK